MIAWFKLMSMMKYLQKLSQKITAVAVIMLLLQSVLPNLVAANISKLNQLTAADGIIAICSGFEIKYIRIDEAGKVSIVDLDEQPQNEQFVHCDNCILSDVSILPQWHGANMPAKLHTRIQIAPTLTVVLALSVNLPPVRAPPYI